MPAELIGLLGALAIAGVYEARERRRRRRLREALHELRRPLQALTLAAGSGAEDPLLAQVRTALADLDVAVAGRRGARHRAPVAVSELLEDAGRRWRVGSGVEIATGADAATTVLEADRVRLGMALDNLIANGLEHGRGPVSVEARVRAGRLRLEVRNGRRRGTAAPDGTPSRPRGLGDPRRGHGLRIAAREASGDGGRLVPPRTGGDGAVVAAVELPPLERSARPAIAG